MATKNTPLVRRQFSKYVVVAESGHWILNNKEIISKQPKPKNIRDFYEEAVDDRRHGMITQIDEIDAQLSK